LRKIYYEKNRDIINAKRRKSPEYMEQLKQRREASKIQTKAKLGEKVYCDICQFHVRRDYLSKHKKTFNHLLQLSYTYTTGTGFP
jgi:hypothetical protein